MRRPASSKRVAWTIVGLLCGWSATAHAYRTFEDDPEVGYAARWARQPIAWELSGDAVVIDPASWERASIAAFAAWQSVECMPFEAELAGVVAEPPAPRDGRNTIGFVATGWAARGFPDRPAFTDVVLERLADGTVVIVEADIYLDGTRAFAVDPMGADELDLQLVLTHEIGHLLGLLHPCGDAGAPSCDTSDAFSASVMHPVYGAGAGTPGPDDVAGLCTIYRGESCLESCAEGLVCDAGRCVDPACGEERCTPMCGDGSEPCDAPRCGPEGSCEDGACALAGAYEGHCVRSGATGTPCERGEECESSLCLTSSRAGSYCTVACADDPDCPGLQRCAEVEGRRVCAPLPPGGCAAAPGSRGALAALPFLFSALLQLRKRSRR